MKIFQTNLNIPLRWMILGVIVLLTGIAALLFFILSPPGSTTSEKALLIVVGLIPGLVVALGQYILAWFEFKDRDRLRKLNILNVLATRDEKDYYANILQSSLRQIDFMGATCSRFLQDFADPESSNPSRRLILDALNRGVKLRILIADASYLSDQESKAKQQLAQTLIRKLLNIEGADRLQIRTFAHAPTTAIVRVDGHLIAGPIFPFRRSQDTPVIHVSVDSPVAESYVTYYDQEWASATPIPAAS